MPLIYIMQSFNFYCFLNIVFWEAKFFQQTFLLPNFFNKLFSHFFQNSFRISFLIKWNFHQFILIIFLCLFQYAEQNSLYDFIYYRLGFGDIMTHNLISILQLRQFFILLLNFVYCAFCLWICMVQFLRPKLSDLI